MSMMIIATSLSAVGAAALTVGGLALRKRLASRSKSEAEPDAGPLQVFVAEHAAFAALDPVVPGLSATHIVGANTARFGDPQAAIAEVSAMQLRVTDEGALHSRPLNTAKAWPEEVRDDA